MPSRWKVWRLPLAGAVTLLLAGGVGWQVLGKGESQQQRPASKGAPPSVKTATVQTSNVDVVVDALGTITPLASVSVKTKIAGHITQIAFQEGQSVKEGDFLVQIDPRPSELSRSQYHGQLVKDQALLKAAENDLARYRVLVEQDSLARQQLDNQQALVDQYRGVVETDRALEENARLNLQYCHITAPVSGRVGLRLVDRGNYVQPTDTNSIVVITQLQPISVIFILPEDSVAQVMGKVMAGKKLDVTVFDRNHTTELARGQLTTVDNQIDTTTGTVKLRAQLPNDKFSLFPNQFVDVRLSIDSLSNATIVPKAAVQRGAPGTFVYVVSEQNTAQVRPVRLGAVSGDVITVESGLQPGDKVVVDGIDKLRDGIAITVRDGNPKQDGAQKQGAGSNPS